MSQNKTDLIPQDFCEHVRVFRRCGAWIGRPLWLVLLGAVSLPACIGPTEDWMLQPLETDRQMGMEVSKQVEESIGIVEDPKLSSYLDSLTRRLETVIPERRFQYRLQIVDQVEPNAFAAPGGHIYVSRGLLTLVNSEAELANSLAHEMVHVEERHTAKQLAKKRVPSLLSLPGDLVGKVISNDLGRLINVPVDTFGTVVLSAYSRQDELEADRLGQQMSAAAGYDPRALAAILDRMERYDALATGDSRRATFFDTHPTTPQRVRELKNQAEKIEYRPQARTAQGPGGVLDHLDGVLVGDNPANGVFRGSEFRHPDLDFFIQFPPTWRTMNSPHAVGSVARRRDGLMFLGIQGSGSDPQQAASVFIDSVAEEFELQPSRSESLTIGAHPAHVVTYTDASGREAMHMHFLWINRRGLMFHIVGLAPERHRQALKESALSFRDLTAEERESIQQTRLRVVTAEAGEDLSRLSSRTGNAWELKELSVINDIPLGRPLQAGQRVKIALAEPYRGPSRR